MDHQQWLEQHDRMMADFDARQATFQANHEKLEASLQRLEASHEKLEASQQKTERTLRRAIRLSVLDARRQRARNADFDVIMAQIAAAQLANEELLKRFLERGGNGKH